MMRITRIQSGLFLKPLDEALVIRIKSSMAFWSFPKLLFIGVILAVSLPTAHSTPTSNSTVVDAPLNERHSPCERVSKLLPVISDLRGLPWRSAPSCKELAPIDLESLVVKRFAREEHLLKQQENAYKLLGLIPRNFPYARCISRARAAGMSGWFDYPSNQIVFAESAPIPDHVIAHELVHALQFQHYPSLFPHDPLTVSSDSTLALAAIVEGDAMTVEHRFLLLHPHTFETPLSHNDEGECSWPPLLANVLYFPYEWGKLFFSIREKEGLASHYFFRTPPSHTRSILYPTDVAAVTDTPLKHRIITREGFHDSLGEFMLRTLLKTTLPRDDAILAAKGLQEDSLRFSSHSRGNSLLLETQWLTESEAKEFFNALVTHVSSLEDSLLTSDSQLIDLVSGNREYHLRYIDTAVHILIQEHSPINKLLKGNQAASDSSRVWLPQ